MKNRFSRALTSAKKRMSFRVEAKLEIYDIVGGNVTSIRRHATHLVAQSRTAARAREK
jgi:hypothetical protein